MTAHDICSDIAALLHPVPVPAGGEDEEDWGAPAEVWEEREEEARQLRLSWEEGGIDPLLATLASLRAERLRLEAKMRLLIAYDDEELSQLTEMLGRAPVALPTVAGAPER